jgi:hypothetical protein
MKTLMELNGWFVKIVLGLSVVAVASGIAGFAAGCFYNVFRLVTKQ